MLTFDYEYTVTMGDTNAMGNFYFVNYFKLQGYIREIWFKNCVENYADYLKDNLVFSTKSAHCDFKIPFFLYDELIVKLYFSELQRVSVKLHFDFYKKGDSRLCASGWQILVFKDEKRKTCRMPIDFANAFRKYASDMDHQLTEDLLDPVEIS